MNFRSFFIALTALVAISARIETASAQQFNWVGNTDADWGTGANWNPLGPPASGTSTVLTFDALAPTFSDLNNSLVSLGVKQITFGSGGPITYTLSGNAVTFTGSTGGILNTSSVLQTINLPLSLSTGISITNNGTAAGTDLRLTGPITLSTNALIFRGTGDTRVEGAIGGAGTVTKNDFGTLTLAGVNTFSGTLTVNQGQLAIAAGGQLYSGVGSVPTIVMSRATGTALLTLTAGAIQTTGVAITFGGSGANTTSQSTIDLGSYATPTTVLYLNGTVTYSNLGNPQGAVITGDNGRIALNGARTFVVGDSSTAADDLSVLVPMINGNLTGSLTKSGTGTLVLGGANTYSGGTSLQQGTIVGTVTNALPLNQSFNISVSNTGATSFVMRGAVSQTIGNLTFYSSSSAATSQGNVSLGDSGLFTVNGNLTVNNVNNPLGALITGSGSSVFTVTGARTWTINDSSNADLELTIEAPSMQLTDVGNIKVGAGAVRIASALSGAGGWDMRDGSLTFAGDTTFSGATTIRGGAVVMDFTGSAAGSRFGTSAPLLLQGGTLRMLGNAGADSTQSIADITLGTTFGAVKAEVVGQAGRTTTFDLGTVTRTAAGNLLELHTSGSGTAAFSTASGTASQVLDFATLDGDFATREAGAGSTRIVAFTAYDTKSDLSTVVSGDDLTSSTLYTNTFVRSVDLASWRFNDPIAQTADLGGARVTSDAGILVGPGADAANQTITGGVLAGDSAGELLLNVTNTGTGELRIASLISDTTSISKFGDGTVQLSGNNDFAGTLRVTAGTVRAAATTGTDGRAIGDNALVSIGGGTLAIADGVSERIGGLISPLSLSNGSVLLGTGSTLMLNMTATPAQNYIGAFVGDSTSTIVKENIGTWTVNQDNNSGFTGSVIVNRGLLIMSGSGVNGGLRSAGSFTINQEGGLLLDDNGASAARTRIGPTAAVTLNGARGLFGGVQTGLLHRADANRNDSEVIGSLTLGGGSSYIRFDNQGASNEPSTRSGISVAAALVRDNNATLSVRGTFLGFDGDGTAGLGSRTRLYFGTTDTATNTGIGTAPAEFGSGADSGTTRRIIPYIVAEFVGTPGTTGNAAGTAVGAANLGNAFATYSDASDTSGAGLRALVIDPSQVQNGSVAETTTFAAHTSSDDNIRESLTADLNVAGSPTVQSLVVHNNSAANVSLAGGGAGAALAVSSGGFLFTGSSGGITVTNFSGGIGVANSSYLTSNGLGGRNEYIVHQMNTSAAGVVFGSSLTTVDADFTKSGAGRLTFTTGVANLFQGLVTINEGILEVSAGAQLGDASAATNDVRLAGGTLRIAGTGFATDTRDFDLLAGTQSQIELTGAAAHRITGAFTGGGSLRVNTTGTGTTKALQLGAVGASFSLGDGRGDLLIGRSTSSSPAFGDLDLSQAADTTLHVDELFIGDADTSGASGAAQGALRLASTGNNTLTARSIVISDNGSGDNTSNSVRSSIVFGSQQNVVNADAITVGGRKGNGLLQFAAGGTLVINGSGGTGTRADLAIADNNVAGTGTVAVGQINATGATLNWSLNSLVIGRHASGAGGAQGTLTFDAGIIDAESIVLARPNFIGDSTTDANTKGTLNVNGNAVLQFGNLRQGSGTATFNVAGTIGARANSPAVIENVQVNLTSAVARFDTGSTSLTIQSAASVAGSGGLNKGGSGTLYFDGVGSYTGGTTLETGLTVLGATGQLSGGGDVTVLAPATLRVDTGGSISAGNVTATGAVVVNGSVNGNIAVQNGGQLSGAGSVGPVHLFAGGTLSPGNGVGELTILGGTTVWEGGSNLKFEFKNAAGSVAGDDWDYLNMSTSVLQVNASSLNKINLLIDSWNADNSGHGGGPGANSNSFDPAANYSWLFASSGGLSPDLDTASLQGMFNVVADTPNAGVTGVGNPYSVVGSFNVVRNGNDLYVNYSAAAVPEPSSILLSMLSAAGLGWRFRRRRQGNAAKTELRMGSLAPAESLKRNCLARSDQ